MCSASFVTVLEDADDRYCEHDIKTKPNTISRQNQTQYKDNTNMFTPKLVPRKDIQYISQDGERCYCLAGKCQFEMLFAITTKQHSLCNKIVFFINSCSLTHTHTHTHARTHLCTMTGVIGSVMWTLVFFLPILFKLGSHSVLEVEQIVERRRKTV